MPGSPLTRIAACAALLTLVLVGWEQCASRDMRVEAIAQVDAQLEQTALAIAAELGSRAVDAVSSDELSALVHRAAREAGVRVTLIGGSGQVRADSDVFDANLASVENHAAREEVIAAASGNVGRA